MRFLKRVLMFFPSPSSAVLVPITKRSPRSQLLLLSLPLRIILRYLHNADGTQEFGYIVSKNIIKQVENWVALITDVWGEGRKKARPRNQVLLTLYISERCSYTVTTIMADLGTVKEIICICSYLFKDLSNIAFCGFFFSFLNGLFVFFVCLWGVKGG